MEHRDQRQTGSGVVAPEPATGAERTWHDGTNLFPLHDCTPRAAECQGPAAGPVGRLIDQAIEKEERHRKHLLAAKAIRRELERLAFDGGAR